MFLEYVYDFFTMIGMALVFFGVVVTLRIIKYHLSNYLRMRRYKKGDYE